MAILFKSSLLCLFLLCLSHALLVNSTEFQVGGKNGWAVPKSKDDFNHWASQNRFRVNDTLRFKYEKDSVLVVSEEEYHKCKSLRPIFFSNNGDTVFKFERAGLFFFISGVSGHCDRGQKMIIKVLEVNNNSSSSSASAESPQSSQNETDSGISGHHHKGGAAQVVTPMTKAASALFVFSSLLGLLFA
ncbi:mavicyanin-like [Senna tora]|uniref:Mavicyanin-like n=1 Tax=Senna tora TaxID=362788 RepID=A0A834SL59_9FABA|nr:mavicyanin-like [Senna tora]